MSVSRETSKNDVIIPRPYETTYALCLLLDSTTAEARELALADVIEQVKKKWTPGWDLSIVIRQPTPREKLRMLIATEEMSNGNEK